MRIFNLFFCLLFILSAALQYNDSDPITWIPIYLFGATLCWLALRKKFYPAAYLAGILIYSAYATFLFFEKDGVLDWWREHNAENIAQSMKATKPWIEATREFFGLVLLTIVLGVNWIFSRRQLPG